MRSFTLRKRADDVTLLPPLHQDKACSVPVSTLLAKAAYTGRPTDGMSRLHALPIPWRLTMTIRKPLGFNRYSDAFYPCREPRPTLPSHLGGVTST